MHFASTDALSDPRQTLETLASREWRKPPIAQSSRRRRGDLVALLLDHEMAEHDLVSLSQRRHHVRRFAVAESVEAAAQGLAVDSDRRRVPGGFERRRNRRGVFSKGGLQLGRIDAVDDQPLPGVGGRIRQPQTERLVQRCR